MNPFEIDEETQRGIDYAEYVRELERDCAPLDDRYPFQRAAPQEEPR